MELIIEDFSVVGSFFFGKTRKAQRFLYNVPGEEPPQRKDERNWQ